MDKLISCWPNNERMALLVTVMFEVWTEGKAPPYSPMTTSLKPGTPDLLGISWSQYGGKTGIWRFMRILDETEIKATICLNAKAAELYPDAVKELHRRGHEIAGHSYTQDLVLPYLTPEEEKEVIQRCSRIIESARGNSAGWLVQPGRRSDDAYGRISRRGRLSLAWRLQRYRPALRVRHTQGQARRHRAQRLHG